MTDSPEGDSDRHMGPLNGPQTVPASVAAVGAVTGGGTSSLVATSPNNYTTQSNIPAPQWVSPVVSASPLIEQQVEFNYINLKSNSTNV